MLTLEEIKQEIEQEKEKYTKPYVKDKGYEMCKTFIDSNSLSNGEQLLTVDMWECFKCSLYLQSNKDLSLEECERYRTIFEMTYGPMTFFRARKISTIMFLIDELENKEILYDYLREEDPIKAENKLRDIPELKISISQATKGEFQDEKYREYLRELHDLNEKVGVIPEIMKLIEKQDKALAQSLAFVIVVKQMIESKKDIDEHLIQIGGLTTRERNRAMSQFYSKIFSIKNNLEVIYGIKGFATGEEQKERETEKENQKMLRNYNKVLEALDKASQKEEIDNPRDCIRGIPNEKIKKEILLWIYNHNQPQYEQLEEEYQELSSKSINKYIAILKRYNISLHPKDVQLIMHNTPEDVEEILSTLPLGTYPKEDLISILQGTKVEIARRIKKYIDAGYLSGEKVKEHLSLYLERDPKLENMTASIEVINAQGINPRIFRGHPEFFWINNELFHKNISLLSTYNLTKSIRNIERYDFLLEESLEEKIDTWVELGFYSYLEQNLELLNHSKQRLNRLYLLKQMNIPIEDLDTLEETLENPKFIVKDDELDDYVMDYASLIQPVEIPFNQEELEAYDADKLSFQIKGSIFSVPKIKRRLASGDSMWNAMFYGKKVTEEEYQKAMSVLMPNEECKK